MLRRSFLALPVFSLACGEEDMAAHSHKLPPFGLPPWHMWGSTDRYTLRLGQGLEANNQALTGRQLVRVNYARPDTWTFLLFVKVESLSANLAPVDVTVFFDVILGIGRASVKLPGVAEVLVPNTLTPATAQTFYRFTTELELPALNAASVAPNLTSKLPAQDLQVSYRIDFVGGPEPVADLNLSVGAFVAPRTHLRPEWFSEEYRGGEKGGT